MKMPVQKWRWFRWDTGCCHPGFDTIAPVHVKIPATAVTELIKAVLAFS
jgi:hypothetical protein